AEARVALVLIDENTYAVPPFKGLPKDLWTPFFGEVLQAIGRGGPDVIGFDIVLPTSIDTVLQDFLKTNLPASATDELPSYDRDFLAALHTLGPAGRLVLAKVRGQGPTIEPPRLEIMM